ncbi:MAG: ABC transporter permease, partial [Ilumatobacteraceae bacterium]
MNYWVQRLTASVMLLLAVSMLTFGAMNLLGDPLFNILGPAAADTKPESLEKVAAAKELYHLDRPLPERYVRWLGDMVTGDFGVQFGSTGQPPVSDLVAERFPRSLTLLVMAQLLASMIAIPWALITAARANRPADRISTINSFLLIAMPNFALAVIL